MEQQPDSGEFEFGAPTYYDFAGSDSEEENADGYFGARCADFRSLARKRGAAGRPPGDAALTHSRRTRSQGSSVRR